jgi:hypothetical protein
MSRWTTIAITATVLLLVSCTDLGLGVPECEPVANTASGAMVLTLQAVPTAEYAPCINTLKLGWDTPMFEVESGRASLSIHHAMTPFLTATLTETCEIGNARPVPHPFVEKYESVRSIESDITVMIIPSAERPRVNSALMTNQFVWIISELDVNEKTLELRSTPEGEGNRGLSANEAIQRIEDSVPEPVYEGNWYFVFEGGCITYEFDAKGAVAETVADDVVTSLGFYPLAELRELGRRQGFDVAVPEES